MKLALWLCILIPSVFSQVYDNSMKQAINPKRIQYSSIDNSINVALYPSDCNGSSGHCDGRHRNEVRTHCYNKFQTRVCLPNIRYKMSSLSFFHIIQLKSPQHSHPLFSIGYYKHQFVIYVFSGYKHIVIGSSNDLAQSCIDVHITRNGNNIDYDIDSKSGQVDIPNMGNAYFKFGLYTNGNVPYALFIKFLHTECN